MNALAIFGVSALMSTVSSAAVGKLYVRPRLRTLERNRALAALVAPHMLRFIGLSLLVLGVVSPWLPAAFAVPAAYGDFVACVLAARNTRAAFFIVTAIVPALLIGHVLIFGLLVRPKLKKTA